MILCIYVLAHFESRLLLVEQWISCFELLYQSCSLYFLSLRCFNDPFESVNTKICYIQDGTLCWQWLQDYYTYMFFHLLCNRKLRWAFFTFLKMDYNSQFKRHWKLFSFKMFDLHRSLTFWQWSEVPWTRCGKYNPTLRHFTNYKLHLITCWMFFIWAIQWIWVSEYDSGPSFFSKRAWRGSLNTTGVKLSHVYSYST